MIVGLLALLVIGGFLGWTLKPSPTIIDKPARIIVEQDLSSLTIAKGETRTVKNERDSIARLLYNSRFRTNAYQGVALHLADSIKRIMDSLKLSSVEVLSKEILDTINTRATIPLPENKDTTVNIPVVIHSGLTWIPSPMNYFSLETFVQPFTIPIIVREYKTTDYIKSDTYRLWVMAGAATTQSRYGFSSAIGISHYYLKGTFYYKHEPTIEIGRTWRLW
jgi:hypothetical protein